MPYTHAKAAQLKSYNCNHAVNNAVKPVADGKEVGCKRYK